MLQISFPYPPSVSSNRYNSGPQWLEQALLPSRILRLDVPEGVRASLDCRRRHCNQDAHQWDKKPSPFSYRYDRFLFRACLWRDLVVTALEVCSQRKMISWRDGVARSLIPMRRVYSHGKESKRRWFVFKCNVTDRSECSPAAQGSSTRGWMSISGCCDAMLVILREQM